MKKSNSNEVRARFLNTLLEIAEQVKKNSDSIDTNQVLQLIDMIIEVNSKDGRIFCGEDGSEWMSK